MSFWRTRAAWLAALTLTLQVGVIATATTALCCGSENASGKDEMACCKESGGAPHVCPIKKKPKPGVPAMESCCTPDQQALAALFSLAGPPESPYASTSVVPADLPVAFTTEHPHALVVAPDAPPPRA